MLRITFHPLQGLLFPVGLLLFSACTIAPDSLQDEISTLENKGENFQLPFEQRTIPELPEYPTWNDMLQRAFLVNGALESAYYQWAMAIAEVKKAGAYPNTPIQLSYQYMFSADKMKTWNRNTFSIGPSPMGNLSWPSKVYQAAKIALDNARAAGERFRAAKFELQRKVLTEWIDYLFISEQIKIQKETLGLLQVLRKSIEARVDAGAPSQELIKVELELHKTENELANLDARYHQKRVALNAMLARPSDAPIKLAKVAFSPRATQLTDQALLRLGVDLSPELTQLINEVEGKKDVLEYARMQYLPDLMPAFGFTGSISQVLGLGISLSSSLPQIRANIESANYELKGSQSMLRQKRQDIAAQFVSLIIALRNSERQARFFDQVIIPAARSLAQNYQQSYESGKTSLLEFIDAKRALLEAMLTSSEAKAQREVILAEIEALVGQDVEGLEQ